MLNRVLLAISGSVAIGCIAAANMSASTRALQTILLLIACTATATAVVLLPAAVRAKAGIFMGAFVAAAGILPVFAVAPEEPSFEPPSADAVTPGPNSRYMAELVRRGPFTESLPEFLEAKRIADVNIADTAALQALDAVQVIIEADPAKDPFADGDGSGTHVFAHMETYESIEAARGRAESSLETAAKRYSLGIEDADAESFCLADPSFWLCGGYRGLVYAEVTLSPSPNANLPLARGTLAALLRYADDRARLATD